MLPVPTDPQTDLDDDIRAVRDRNVSLDRQRAAEQFRSWARAALGTAHQAHTHGDHFGRQLAEQRAAVYEEAAKLADGRRVASDLLPVGDWHVLRADGEDTDMAVVLMRLAQSCSVGGARAAPLTNYDQVAIRYSRARAWQLCAWELNPSLPEVQPKWP